MDGLKRISTEDLLAELNARKEKPTKVGEVLVFGTICSDAGRDFVEMLIVIDSEKDLNFMRGLKLKARFNSHRKYRGFYFKTDANVFDKLNERCTTDNEGFSEWVKETKSIKLYEL